MTEVKYKDFPTDYRNVTIEEKKIMAKELWHFVHF